MCRPAVLCRAPGAGARRARLPRRAGWRPRAAWPPRARDEVRGCATARACRGGDFPPEGPRAGPRWGALRPSRRTSRASRACVRTYVRTLRARCGAHLPRALQPAGAGDEGLAARRGDDVACRHVEKAVARGAGEGGRLLPPRPSRAPLGVWCTPSIPQRLGRRCALGVLPGHLACGPSGNTAWAASRGVALVSVVLTCRTAPGQVHDKARPAARWLPCAVRVSRRSACGSEGLSDCSDGRDGGG